MSKRDAVILAGWTAAVVGLLLALGVGYGLVASGALTILLGLYAVADE